MYPYNTNAKAPIAPASNGAAVAIAAPFPVSDAAAVLAGIELAAVVPDPAPSIGAAEPLAEAAAEEAIEAIEEAALLAAEDAALEAAEAALDMPPPFWALKTLQIWVETFAVAVDLVLAFCDAGREFECAYWLDLQDRRRSSRME